VLLRAARAFPQQALYYPRGRRPAAHCAPCAHETVHPVSPSTPKMILVGGTDVAVDDGIEAVHRCAICWLASGHIENRALVRVTLDIMEIHHVLGLLLRSDPLLLRRARRLLPWISCDASSQRWHLEHFQEPRHGLRIDAPHIHAFNKQGAREQVDRLIGSDVELLGEGLSEFATPSDMILVLPTSSSHARRQKFWPSNITFMEDP
jgi:hypothetical protein